MPLITLYIITACDHCAKCSSEALTHTTACTLQEVWTPSEHMEPGAGFGRPNCAAILIGDTPLSDVSYIEREARHTPEGKQSQVAYVVVGMHVWHQKPDEASPIPSQDQHGAYHQV